MPLPSRPCVVLSPGFPWHYKNQVTQPISECESPGFGELQIEWPKQNIELVCVMIWYIFPGYLEQLWQDRLNGKECKADDSSHGMRAANPLPKVCKATLPLYIEEQYVFWEQNLSKMGLSEVRRAVIPPVAPRAKKKNIPARSFGWRSLALAFSSCMQVTWPKLRVLLSMMEDKVHSKWSWDYKIVW